MKTIHILFSDGSNPFVRFNLTPEEFDSELRKWSKSYNLTLIKESDGIYHYRATKKESSNPPPLF